MTNEELSQLELELELNKGPKEADKLMERYLGKELNEQRKESVWLPQMLLQMRMIELLEENNKKLDILYDKLCKKRCF